MREKLFVLFLLIAFSAKTSLPSHIEQSLTTKNCVNQTNKKTFNMPYVEETISQYSILRAIELTDSATTVQYSFVHRPGYWCRISGMELVGNQTGNVYPLKRAVGYELGEKKHMPSSGRFDFTMEFPAIDPRDTSVDMVEIETDGAKIVIHKGIALSEQPVCKYTTHIAGTYEGSAGFVGFMKSGENPRYAKLTWIPVDDGKFDYVLHSDDLTVFDIFNGPSILLGSWSSNRFFSEDGTININFKIEEYPDDATGIEFHDITINAPAESLTESLQALNKRLKEHYDQAPAILYRDSLEKAEKYYIPEYYAFAKTVKAHPEQRDSLSKVFWGKYGNAPLRTPEGEIAEAAVVDYVENERVQDLCDQAVAMNNLAGLFSIAYKAYFPKDNTKLIDAYIKAYQGKYPESEYAIFMEKLVGSNEIYPGSPFNDFTAKDIKGNIHTLSKLIEGKPALLDLWASWCGPCRRLSKSMIPIYEEFAPKGFTIIGVAREYGNADAAVKAIEKDGYRWLNLFEIDDANGIWNLYRCHNAAGGTFLISPDGKIVKSGVSAEDVREYLNMIYSKE